MPRLATANMAGESAATEAAPTVLTFTLPSVSDETVQVTTLTCSAGTTHVAVTESATPPAYPGAEWVAYNGGSPPVAMVSSNGETTLYAHAHSAGGTSETPLSASVTVNQSPWSISDCVGYWGTAPWGSTTGTNPVTGVADVQPAGTYPAGKTQAYSLTSVAGITIEGDGALTGGDGTEFALAATPAAELAAFFDGDDPSLTWIVVAKGGTAGWQAGPHFGSPNLLRLDFAGSGNLIYFVSTDSNAQSIPDADMHVYAVHYDGATHKLSWYTEDGPIAENITWDKPSLTLATFTLGMSNLHWQEMCFFSRALSGAELVSMIQGAAARRNLPFDLTTWDLTLPGWYEGEFYELLETNGLLDDGAMLAESASELPGLRSDVLDWMWGSDGVTSATPSVTADVANPCLGLTGFSSVDRLDLTVASVPLLAYHYHASDPNGKCLIVCHGHGHYAQGSGGIGRVMAAALAAGYSLISGHMPGEYTGHTEGHSTLLSGTRWSATAGSPMRIMLAHYVAAHVLLSGDYSEFSVTGLSGGGWTAALLGALFTWIAHTYPVSGTVPLYARTGTAIGDTEQWYPPLFERAGWLDLYAMAAHLRRCLLIYNTNDSVFGPLQHPEGGVGGGSRMVGKTFDVMCEDFVAEILAMVGASCMGWHRVTDDTGHEYTDDAAALVVADMSAP